MGVGERADPRTGFDSPAERALRTEEARLVSRIRAGEGRLYAVLVERYQRRLYWSCLRVLGDPDEADDVVQEAFVRAYTHLADYDPAYRFYTWTFRIARNLALNRLRRRKLWGYLSFSAAGEAPELAIEDSAAAGVENRELAEALSRCLQTLSSDQRECFRLRHEEEFSYAEIAQTLEIPIGTVMSRLARAREKMRVCLEARGITFA